jgi:hypothetical protein
VVRSALILGLGRSNEPDTVELFTEPSNLLRNMIPNPVLHGRDGPDVPPRATSPRRATRWTVYDQLDLLEVGPHVPDGRGSSVGGTEPEGPGTAVGRSTWTTRQASGSTYLQIAITWAAPAITTIAWNTSWKPNHAGHGSGLRRA